MASVRMTMLAPALALALPLPAEATIHLAVCGQSVAIDIPLHRDGDGNPPEKRFAACHGLGFERSRRARDHA
jgi:hypothetical protein